MKKIQKTPDLTPEDFKKAMGYIDNPEQISKIFQYNEAYYHWDELKYRVDEKDLRSTWALMKILRTNTSKRIQVCGLDLSYSLIPSFQECLYHIDRDSAGPVSVENPGERTARRYVMMSFMEEAIASSQIEGAATTRQEAKRMLRAQRKPRDNSERMIFNNYEAMEHIKSTLDKKMDIELILEMHRAIAKGTLREGPQWEGRFREDDQTFVGSPDREDLIFHIPPKYEQIPGMMEDLCEFINNEDEFIHPIVKGIIIHYLIGYIHPFVDGNGRLARSLFYWYAMKRGYWLMEYASISRVIRKSQTKYGLAYQYSETDDHDLTYFIKFNLKCIETAVDDLRRYIERKVAEQKNIVKMIESNPELNMYEMTVLKDYTKDPSPFSIREISNRYPISYQSARLYVRHLCELGYVRALSKNRKTVLYVVTDDIDWKSKL